MNAGSSGPLSDDRVLGGRVRLRQPLTGYRVAIDPVFLAAAVDAQPGETVLDVGCGVGAASLCLAARVAGVSVTGIDNDPALIATAGGNARENGMADRVRFLVDDLARPAAELAIAGFDRVMTNPPYCRPGSGRAPRQPGRRTATIEETCGLDVWLGFCVRMVRVGGVVTLVHRADRLDDVLATVRGRLGGLRVFPLWPGGAEPRPARRVLICGRRGSAEPLRLLPGLTLHRPDGRYGEAAEAVLRDAGALAWEPARDRHRA